MSAGGSGRPAHKSKVRSGGGVCRRPRSLCRSPLAVRGVRRGEGRVVGEEAQVVRWGDPDAGGAVRGEALGGRLVRVVPKHAVGDPGRSVKGDQPATGGQGGVSRSRGSS